MADQGERFLPFRSFWPADLIERVEPMTPCPTEHDGNFDLRRITGLGKDLVDLVRMARSTGETPPSNMLRTRLGRVAYDLRVAWIGQIELGDTLRTSTDSGGETWTIP